MANTHGTAATSPAWAPANPWCWAWLGVGSSGLAFVWARVLSDSAPVVRISLVAAGLLASAAAVCIRLRSSGDVVDSQPPAARSRSLLGLAILDMGLAAVISLLLITKLSGMEFVPWATASVAWLWVAVAPWCALRALVLLKRRATGMAVQAPLESSCVLTVAALATFLACWALYLGKDRADDCDTLRLLLAVAALLLFVVAPVVAAPVWLRRAIVSVALLLHLGGIMTAVTAAPPGPWVSIQVWMHFYRPYLEFMYLNNAYRFYSPEPAPSTQLWFWVQYKDADDKIIGRWTKLPRMDDRGRSPYAVGLQFQRRLALTENVTRTMQTPPSMWVVRDEAGKFQPLKFYKRRDDHSPNPEFRNILGMVQPPNPLGVPYHPDSQLPQYAPPEPYVKQLMSSYARFVLSEPNPENPRLVPYRVKVYRVLHRIAEPNLLASGADPEDPTFFLPYYQGMFDTKGNLLDGPDKGDRADPFLYWILPILRDDWGRRDSTIRLWVLKHAGDPEWERVPGLQRKMFGAP